MAVTTREIDASKATVSEDGTVTLNGTSANDIFIIPADFSRDVIIKPRSHTDTLWLQGENNKTLVFHFTEGNTRLTAEYTTTITVGEEKKEVKHNITIMDYYTDETCKNTKSSLKYLKVGDEETRLFTDSLKYVGKYNIVAGKVVGTPFIDEMDFSTEDQRLTINGAAGPDYIIGGKKGNVIYGGEGDDRLTAGLGASTINGGKGDDIMVGSPKNDKFVGGEGKNTILFNVGEHYLIDEKATYTTFGSDTIVLSKNEQLYLLANDLPLVEGDGADEMKKYFEFDYSDSTKDLVIKVYNSKTTHDDTTLAGSFKIAGYGKKDIMGPDNGAFGIVSEKNVIYDIREYFDKHKVTIDSTYKAKTYSASWLNEEIDAQGYQLYTDKARTIKTDDSSLKGLSIYSKAGGQYTAITGTKYSDTITSTVAMSLDTVNSSLGNDKINLGSGDDIIKYTSASHFTDTVTLSKHEGLWLDVVEAIKVKDSEGNVTGTLEPKYEIVNNDVKVTIGDYTTVVKNVATKNTAGSGSAAFLATSYDESGNYKDYVNLLNDAVALTVTTDKSYKGKYFKETINASSAQKGVTISAVGGDDIITGSDYNDIIKAGVGDAQITAGKGNDKIYSEAGSNTFIFRAGDGLDTVYTGTNSEYLKGSDTLKFTGYETTAALAAGENVKVINSGADLKIQYSAGDVVTLAKYNTNSYNSVQYVAANTGSEITLDAFLEAYCNAGHVIGVEGSGKIIGTTGNDDITGSKKADKITTKTGNDTIDPGKGNDTVTIDGSGSKTVKFLRGDGKDTIVYAVESGDTSLTLSFGDYSATGAAQKYTVSGSDLIITTTYSAIRNEQNKITTKASIDTVTIKDYTKYKNLYLKLGSAEAQSYATVIKEFSVAGVKSSTGYTFTGTDYNDVIVGTSKADDIYTSHGVDVITAGAGNDTININGIGKKTLNFSKGSGNDTIIDTYLNTTSEGDPPDNLARYIGLNYEDTADISIANVGDTNDILLTAQYKNASGKVLNTSKVTIKDFTKSTSVSNGAYILNYAGRELTLKDYIGNTLHTSSYEKANARSHEINIGATNDTKDIYYIQASDKKYNTNIVDHKNDDIYILAEGEGTLSITDLAGEDSLIIENSAGTNPYRLIFDVSIDSKKDANSSLLILNTDKLAEKSEDDASPVRVMINGFIKQSTDGTAYEKGSGFIESIKIGNMDYHDISSDINTIKQNVVSWLTTNGDGATSVFGYIENHTKTQLMAEGGLIAQFNYAATVDTAPDIAG